MMTHLEDAGKLCGDLRGVRKGGFEGGVPLSFALKLDNLCPKAA